MTIIDLARDLPGLIPAAVAWAESASAAALERGRPLREREMDIARAVGVRSPERVRLAVVQRFPFPDEPSLRRAAMATGMLGPDTAGLTLGHAVLIAPTEYCDRLLAHEFRHVFQDEEAGSIAAFLPEYLRQVVAHGYADAPYEMDARTHERLCGSGASRDVRGTQAPT